MWASFSVRVAVCKSEAIAREDSRSWSKRSLVASSSAWVRARADLEVARSKCVVSEGGWVTGLVVAAIGMTGVLVVAGRGDRRLSMACWYWSDEGNGCGGVSVEVTC